MAKKLQKFLKSFTLIELIIVIAIIAVLGVAAFLVLTQWMSKGRDAQRISDLSTIKSALDIGSVKNGKLPIPDDKNDLLYSGTQILYQGKFGQTVVNELGSLTKIPTDRTNGEYDYSLVDDEKTYMVRAIMENQVSGKDYVSRVNALDQSYKFVGKQLKGIVIENMFIYLPSMFATGYVGNKLDMLNDNPIFEGEKPGVELTGLVLENNNDIILAALTGLGLSSNDASLILSQAKGVTIQPITQQPELLSCDGIPSGQTKLFYKENNVAFGQSCDLHQKEFNCENGVWKDGTNNADIETYKYITCTVGPANNCEATTNTQKSTTNLDIVFNIPATEHGLGFDTEKTVNENNGVYKYTLQGNCNNGNLENIVVGNGILENCNLNYIFSNGSCLYDGVWTGNSTDGFTFLVSGVVKYPLNCNDLITSTNPNFKIGLSSPFNGTKFVNGIYKIKPSTNLENAYCNFDINSNGRTLVMNLDTNDGGVKNYSSSYRTDTINYGTIGNSLTADYKNGTLFQKGTDNLLLATHEEGNLLAYKEYSFNEINKSLYYYFNKGANTRLTNGTISSFGLQNLNAKEPTIKQTSDLYVNTNRGSADLDRVSIGGIITNNYGGGLGTYYDYTVAGTQRPYGDGQLLNCFWENSACTIGNDNSGTNSSRNIKSGLQYDYSFYIK